ncbi:MAG TPA: SWIM zinc finger family protein [Anaerolineales bacterium]|nr:SWIM zinc finger family protein [Anaerolineales bacterium]
MPTPPQLTDDDIEAYIPDPYFGRGQDYYQSGHIFDTVRRGQQIEGYCEGSAPEPYHVIVTLDKDSITGDSCSCPMDGGCKHVVALLLTWAHKPKSFVQQKPVETELKDKSKDELTALVQEMLKRDPSLERLIDMPTPDKKAKRRARVSPEAYRRQIRYAMNRAGDWYAVRSAAHEIGAVVDVGDKFAEQEDWESAQIVYRAALDEALPEYFNTHDEGDISGELTRAVEGLMECLAARAEETKARRALIRALFEVLEWDIEKAGGIGLSDGVADALKEHATPDDRREIQKWIGEASKTISGDSWSNNYHREAWGRLLESFMDQDDAEAFIKQARELGLHRPLFDKLLGLHRMDEALEVAQKHLTSSGWEILKCAESLDAARYAREAVAFVESNLKGQTDDRLFEWLAKQYAKRGDHEDALKINLTRWQTRPSLELYKDIVRLATKLKEWDSLRPQLLAGLRQNAMHVALLIDVHLEEQEWDAAWEVVKKQNPLWSWSGLRVKVAKATEKHRPAMAIDAYLAAAESEISQRSRPHYATAAQYLRRASILLTGTNRASEWQTLIAGLRESHKGLPALQDELNKAKL